MQARRLKKLRENAALKTKEEEMNEQRRRWLQHKRVKERMIQTRDRVRISIG